MIILVGYESIVFSFSVRNEKENDNIVENGRITVTAGQEPSGWLRCDVTGSKVGINEESPEEQKTAMNGAVEFFAKILNYVFVHV